MSVLKPNMFKGNMDVGQTPGDFITLNIQAAIDQWEPMYFVTMVGRKLYDQLLQYYGATPPTTPPAEIAELYVRLYAGALRYVYCHYLEDNKVLVTGAGASVPETSVSKPVSPIDEQAARWNEGADTNIAFVRWMYSDAGNKDTYPDWSLDGFSARKQHLFQYSNLFGIWSRPWI